MDETFNGNNIAATTVCELAISPWVGTMSTSQTTVMLCGCGVKACIVHIWRQVKLCKPFYNTCYIRAL